MENIRKIFINQFNENRERLALCLLTLILFLIAIRNIGQLGVFTVLDDEFGYWGNAAYFVGLDWSTIVSEIPYYSYGYSLVLVPLFWIFEEPTYIYKAAVVLNGIFLCVGFLLCYDIGKKLSAGSDKSLLLSIAILIFMYPSYIVYLSIGWAESLLTLIVWGLAWSFIGLDEKSTHYKPLIIGVLATYSYIIHQRSIGILIASILTLLIMFFFKRLNQKQLLIAILPIVLMLIAHHFIKADLQSTLWLNSAGRLANDYKSQVGKITSFMTLKGWIAFIKALIGHLFYLGIASFLMVYYGLYKLIRDMWKISYTLYRKKKVELQLEHVFFNLFVLLAFTLSLLISAIFFKEPNRIDHIVYGRYVEILIGPVMLVGLLELLTSSPISKRLRGIGAIGLIVLGGLTHFIIETSGLEHFNPLHSVGLALMMLPSGILLPIFMALLGARILRLAAVANRKKMHFNLLLIACLSFALGNSVSNGVEKLNQERLEIVKNVEFIRSDEVFYPIYFLWNGMNHPTYDQWDNRLVLDRLTADVYQFLLMERQVILIDTLASIDVTIPHYVIATDYVNRDDLDKAYSLYDIGSDSYLYVSKEMKRDD